jgi:iron complex outermembrane receptor protein
MKMKKRLRHLLLYAIAFLLCFSSFAQERKVSGRVTDPQNQALIGVTVSVKGKSVSTTTDANGAFSITATTQDVLVFTSVGFESMEAKASADGLAITLNIAVGNLNEVVVVGYGTARKKDLTGAVSTVSAKDFIKGAITTPEQMIAGKVAGVSIISNGGAPGSGSTIRIRGGSSLSASNDPLIVIDGVPLDNSGISGSANPLSLINSNDI